MGPGGIDDRTRWTWWVEGVVYIMNRFRGYNIH